MADMDDSTGHRSVHARRDKRNKCFVYQLSKGGWREYHEQTGNSNLRSKAWSRRPDGSCQFGHVWFRFHWRIGVNAVRDNALKFEIG